MPLVAESTNIILRMHADLDRTLKRPVNERHWGMVIDLQKCVGCHACTIACKSENKTPPGVSYHVVMDEEIGRYPNVTRRFLPRPCMQCEHPPCTRVCPVHATYRRPDGVVAINYEVCIGCRYCLTACPYGARSFDFGDFYTVGHTPKIAAYDTAPEYEYGRMHRRDPNKRHTSPIGNARKCTFCLHRLENGMLPACITTCIGGARVFGDLNDSLSLVTQAASSPRVMRLKEELGTEPSVFYLL